jgi:WD40 repeat protein
LVVVTATSDGAVGCLDLSDKRYAFLTTSPSPSTRAGARAVTSVCHSRYGQIVCAACDDGAARGWDAATGALVFVCKETFDVLDRDPATSVCFRPFRDENDDENASATFATYGQIVSVSFSPSGTRPARCACFLSSLRLANEKDKKIGRGHSETQLACALVAEVTDAHAPGAAVDALAFAGRGANKTLFSAARDGTLCAIERFIESPNTDLNPSESWGTENERERFRASRRMRVGATGARASLAASPCGGYVLVAACAGSLGAAATGGSRSSSHVLAFDAETLVLKPPAMRNARGGVAALAASRRTKRTLPPRDRQTVTNDDDSSSSSDERSFSVFVAGDDAAAVVSRHNFDASWRANETVCVDGQNNCEASLEPSTPLSAASLVRTAAEPISVLRDAHAPTRLARLKRHVKDAGDKEDGGGVLAATLGVAVHPAGHVVVTCGADGTLLVSPANAFADPTERIYRELRRIGGGFVGIRDRSRDGFTARAALCRRARGGGARGDFFAD